MPRYLTLLWMPLLALSALGAPSVDWVPSALPPAPARGPILCQAAYLTPAQGRAVLDAALARFPNRDAWQAYVDHARCRIQGGAGLDPWPRRSPLNAVVRARRVHEGYSVENVAFESVPGYFVTGNLYRPLDPKPPYAVVLITHGHASPIEKPEDYDHYGRFDPSTQACGAALARMGAVALAVDMFGMGDSILEVGQEAHAHPFSMTIQLWDNIRAVDFLLSLDGADPSRVGVTGYSGGGTQAFLLTAVDPRIRVSVPVVMVSAYFFGGCPCESGLPIHRSADHFVNNAMIASFAAPRPMLVVSDGIDWTSTVPTLEFPFLKRIYAYYGAEDQVAHVHLPKEGHDYGPSKREAMYRFMAQHLDLNLAAVEDGAGRIDESRIAIERSGPMHVFNGAFPVPARALRDSSAVKRALEALQG